VILEEKRREIIKEWIEKRKIITRDLDV